MVNGNAAFLEALARRHELEVNHDHQFCYKGFMWKCAVNNKHRASGLRLVGLVESMWKRKGDDLCGSLTDEQVPVPPFTPDYSPDDINRELAKNVASNEVKRMLKMTAFFRYHELLNLGCRFFYKKDEGERAFSR